MFHIFLPFNNKILSIKIRPYKTSSLFKINYNSKDIKPYIDKSKFHSFDYIKKSPKNDANLIHFNNLLILYPTQFDIAGSSDKDPYKIEVTNSIMLYEIF